MVIMIARRCATSCPRSRSRSSSPRHALHRARDSSAGRVIGILRIQLRVYHWKIRRMHGHALSHFMYMQVPNETLQCLCSGNQLCLYLSQVASSLKEANSMIDEIAAECSGGMLKLMQNPDSERELVAVEDRMQKLEDASRALKYI